MIVRQDTACVSTPSRQDAACHGKPLAIDLYCGLGGWTEGLLAEGYDVVGYDNERHEYGDHRYPAQLILQDVLSLHGSRFAGAALIVASPPCQEFSYMAMPWSRAKKIAVEYRNGTRDRAKLTALFDACFRIQREASAAAGKHIPLVVENVKGAQPWVGRARWHYGSYYLWGDVPALMPMTCGAFKTSGQNWARDHAAGKVSPHWNISALKNSGGSWFNVAHNTTSGKSRNPDGRPLSDDGVKHHGSGAVWFDTGVAKLPSSSPRRKAASALIAKIPLPLAQHIARVYKPQSKLVL